MILCDRYHTLTISDYIVQNSIMHGKHYVDLSYTYKGKLINDRILLTYTQSNLNNGGKIWFFICSHTSKRCRKIHLIGTHFLHRTAYKKIYYESQTHSYMDRLLCRFPKADKAQKLINSKYFKKYYKGKPTKRYLKCLNQIEKANKGLITLRMKLDKIKREVKRPLFKKV